MRISAVLCTGILLAGCAAQAPTTEEATSSSVVRSIATQSSSARMAESSSSDPSAEWSAPVSRYEERVTKKPFGIRIDPATSPVQPERFSGYHTGADFEAFEDEAGTDVTVSAVCTGPVRFSGFVNGYGGVLVQQCVLGGDAVTVLYGHLAAREITTLQELKAGERVGRLGEQGPETDGERKHLHLSIHEGTVVNYRGYVATQAELANWVDVMDILKDI